MQTIGRVALERAGDREIEGLNTLDNGRVAAAGVLEIEQPIAIREALMTAALEVDAQARSRISPGAPGGGDTSAEIIAARGCGPDGQEGIAGLAVVGEGKGITGSGVRRRQRQLVQPVRVRESEQPPEPLRLCANAPLSFALGLIDFKFGWFRPGQRLDEEIVE